MNWTEF